MQRALGLEPMALAFVDVEGLKWINHRFGYATGDQMFMHDRSRHSRERGAA
jgi:GGDEF domain-containing protein